MKQPSRHASDNRGDRTLGAVWERHFCDLAKERGFTYLPHQFVTSRGAASAWGLGQDGDEKQVLLPDVTVWGAVTQHHEIKHKNPTPRNEYGLEQYRLERLVDFANRTNELVLYTIHDWQRAGATSGREAIENNINHWLTVDILALSKMRHRVNPNCVTYIDGQRDRAPVWFWPTHYWVELSDFWNSGRAINTRGMSVGVY